MSSSSPAPAAADQVPPGHVRLILLQEEDSSFYLEIPLDIIHSLCLKPRKYLVFLGWCILGVEGVLTRNDDDEIETDGDLDDEGIYYYATAGIIDLSHAVDPEVIKLRTNTPSESTGTRNNFRNSILDRDARCVWTGTGPVVGVAMHIIPYQRGSEWFRLIVDNRPSYSEDVSQLRDINDIRNGVFATATLHLLFDPRWVVILKTPNHVLSIADIPPRHQRTVINDVKYPNGARYTLQWLKVSDQPTFLLFPNNIDATFKKHTRKPKPSDLLLHYNYGAAAVKWWGHGTELLQNRAKPPRPSVPVTALPGSSRTTHNRNIAIQKRNAARAGGQVAGNTGTGAGAEEMVDLADQAEWDEDDVMLFFWGNSKASTERHRKKMEESTQRMEQWREGVS